MENNVISYNGTARARQCLQGSLIDYDRQKPFQKFDKKTVIHSEMFHIIQTLAELNFSHLLTLTWKHSRFVSLSLVLICRNIYYIHYQHEGQLKLLLSFTSIRGL